MSTNLHFIKSATGDNVASVSVEDCFSDAYDVYMITITKWQYVGTSNAGGVRFIDSSGSIISDSEYNHADLQLRNYAGFQELKSEGGSITEGIGTGWASGVPQFHPLEIVENLRELMKGNACKEMIPWFRGFSGEIEKLSSHLGFWLKKQAHTTIIPLAQYKASQINKTISRVTICDTRSRWGSCSAKGKLSFSWRLIMAPPEILDYVVAHEVSHLAHMDHSSRFWATVEILSTTLI